MKTTCGFDLERLSAWMDGALDEAERRATGEHVSACAACRARVEEFRRLDAGVRDLPLPGWTEASAPRFAAGVMARIASARAESPAAVAPAPLSAVAPARTVPEPAAIRRSASRTPLPWRDPRASWLVGTLSVAAALLLVLAGTGVDSSRSSRGADSGFFPAPTQPPAVAFKAGQDPAGDATVRPGKGGPVVTGKGGVPEGQSKGLPPQTAQRFGAWDSCTQTLNDSQKQVVEIFSADRNNDGLPGMSGTNVVGRLLEPDATAEWRACSNRAQAQVEMQYRGVDHANPAVAVDASELADRSLAASEAIMTLLVNSSDADAEGLPDLRGSILTNGVDDRMRAALNLAQDPERVRPLAQVQVLLVRLANGADNPGAEELDELKRAIVGNGLIEEVRQTRSRVQSISRAQTTAPDPEEREPVRAK